FRTTKRSAVPGGGAEAAVGGLGQAVGGEAHQEVAAQQVVGLCPPLQAGELLGIVAVVDPHRVPYSHVAEVLEPLQPRHHASSSSGSLRPVGTSAEHLGQMATALSPTMKLKPHSGHWIRGDGPSVTAGSPWPGAPVGGMEPGGGAPPGPAAPGRLRTMLTEPHTGQAKRPSPGTSNWVRHAPHRTITPQCL